MKLEEYEKTMNEQGTTLDKLVHELAIKITSCTTPICEANKEFDATLEQLKKMTVFLSSATKDEELQMEVRMHAAETLVKIFEWESKIIQQKKEIEFQNRITRIYPMKFFH